MESAGKASGNNGAVLERRPAGSRCEDCAKGSIQGWQRAARRTRGLAGIVARGGGPADAAGDRLGGLAGHPAPQFATADLSVFPSGNHLVRFPMRLPGLADTSGVAGHGSDTAAEITPDGRLGWGYAALGTSMTSYPMLLRRWTSLVVERLRATWSR